MSGPKEKAKKPDFARKPQQGREWKGNDRIKMKTLGKEAISINRETIDLRYVEQITDSEQVTSLGYCVKYAQRHLLDGTRTLQEVVAMLERRLRRSRLPHFVKAPLLLPIWPVRERRRSSHVLTGIGD